MADGSYVPQNFDAPERGGASLPSHPLDLFDRIAVINLRSRTDRRREMEEELAAIEMPLDRVVWFDAVRPEDAGPFDSIGARGCFMSHLGILNDAVAAGVQRLLILEDDAHFVRDFVPRMTALANELRSRHWQMFYGGGDPDALVPVGPGLAELDFQAGVRCTHFVALQGSAILAARDYLVAQLGRPAGDPAGGPMPVDGSYSWARRELKLVTLMADPPVAGQRSSRSDITTRAIDRYWITAALVPMVRRLRNRFGRDINHRSRPHA